MERATVWIGGIAGCVLLGTAISCANGTAGRVEPTPNVDLVTETVASGFDTVWEIVWGPDNHLWVTERPGRISRVNPETSDVTAVANLAVAEVGEGGLMGFALHPDFPTQPFAYAVHTYQASGGTRNRVVRMTWDGSSLGPPQELLGDIPGASIHDGSRLVFGPDRLLYITTGDAAQTELAQITTSLAGKVLRLTPEGAPAPGNPLGGAIYTYGHRNPQGIAFAPDGSLYSTEHGPGDNDEVNRIEAGRNYGWPVVRGRCDGDAGGNEVAFCQANDVAEPLSIWTPTIAPAGLAYYDASLIPGWRGSLLFATLKGRTLVRLSLAPDGRSVTAEERLFEGSFGRLRAVLVAPDGSVYIGTSNKDGRGAAIPADDRIIRIRPRS